MLTHEDRTTEHHPADVDASTPVLRRVASRSLNWWTAILLVCGPGVLLVALLAVAPFLAILFVLGLAGSAVKLVWRRDWAALATIAGACGLVVVGYVTARGLVHSGLPTLEGWSAHVRSRAVDPHSWHTAWTLSATLVASLAYFGSLLAFGVCTTYALVRPHRTRFSRTSILVAVAVLGAAIGFVG